MRWTSIRLQYAAASAAIFAIGFGVSALFAIRTVEDSNQRALQQETQTAADQALVAMNALNQRMATISELSAANPRLTTVVEKNDLPALTLVAEDMIEIARNVDSAVSTFEITDKGGTVLMRGHNPGLKGDQKGHLAEIKKALSGLSTFGLTVSPTSGQAALDGITPLRAANGAIIGTLKVGAYASPSLANQIKARTRAEFAIVFRGKVTISTLSKDSGFELPSALLHQVSDGSLRFANISIGEANYLADIRYMPSLAENEGIYIVNMVNTEAFLARTENFVQNMLMFGGVTFPIVIILGFLAGNYFGRPIIQTAKALEALTLSGEANLARYERRRDEIGDMAKAFGNLRTEVEASFRLRQTVAGMPTGVLTLSRHSGWIVDYVNPALELALNSDAGTPVQDQSLWIGKPAFSLLAGAGLTEADLETLPDDGLRRQIRFGDKVFALTLANIHAPSGDKIGAMVAWQDISERFALACRFEDAIGTLATTLETVATNLFARTNEVRSAASATQTQADVAARSSIGTSVSVTTVASAANELSASIQDISSQMDTSMQIAAEAAHNSQRVANVVTELQAAAGRISGVVQSIGSIAAQTNLLALNATIEAARAGDAGRGFAVVASEVKALAGQTASAADNVVLQVGSIQAITASAVDAIASISSTIERVGGLSSHVAAAIEQQRRATDEIARNTHQSANGTHEVAQSINEVSSATRRTELAVDDMLGQTEALQDAVQALRKEVNEFLSSLAA